MPKQFETSVASTSKKSTLPAKRKLTNARDYKGGKKETSKKRTIFDKAVKEEKQKRFAAKLPGINVVEELKNGPCKNYERYNAHVKSGEKWNQELYDDDMVRLATCYSQTLESGDRFCNNIIKI